MADQGITSLFLLVSTTMNSTQLHNRTAPQTTKLQNCSLEDGSLRVLLAVSYSLLFFLGLVGNLLALWVFLRLHSRKNSVRIFLINLAMADLLLVFCLPFRIAYHANHEHWEVDPIFCRIVGNIFYMNMYISIVLLGLISIDRYMKLRRASSKQRFLSSRQSTFLCCLVWVVSVAFISPMIAFSAKNSQTNKCFQYKHLQKYRWKAYMNLAVVVLFWIIYAALIMSYWRIAMRLLSVSREKSDLPNAAKYGRTARKSFFVLFLFTVCFVPYHLVRIFYIISQIRNVSCRWVEVVDKANEVALLLSAFNSCLDPAMYFVLCGSVRRTVMSVVRKTLCMASLGVSSSSSSEAGKCQRDQQTGSDTSTLRKKILVQNSDE